LRDFKRASDHADMPEEKVAPYDDQDAHVGELVYRPGA
jgi:hypothetical protein